jgi:hypothetical protein
MKKGERAGAKAESRVRDVLRRQYGLVTRHQALQLGLTSGQIRHRRESGEWELAQSGIYRAAAVPRDHRQDLLAACLAAGPVAAASHQSAAWLWGLTSRPPGRPTISVPAPLRPRLREVTVHRSRDFDPSRTVEHLRIPCTDPLRVATDLAAVLPPIELTGLVDAAIASKLVTTDGLLEEIRRRGAPGRSGPAGLRRELEDRGIIGGPEPSVLEAECMRLFKRSGIPILRREVRFGPDGQFRIDFLIAPGLAVEVDGFVHHWSPEAKAHDEARRNRLRFLLVYTWRDIHTDGRRVAAEVARAMFRTAA